MDEGNASSQQHMEQAIALCWKSKVNQFPFLATSHRDRENRYSGQHQEGTSNPTSPGLIYIISIQAEKAELSLLSSQVFIF